MNESNHHEALPHEQPSSDTITVTKSTRWPGLLLSLLVPGFGLFRAGDYLEGFKWFTAIFVLTLLTSIAFALNFVPVSVAYTALSMTLIAQLWMLKESFRSGKMTLKLWGLYFILLVALFALPHPSHWVAHPLMISTSSMEPTLMSPNESDSGDHVIINKLSYVFQKPKRGDLMAFNAALIPGTRDYQPSKVSPVIYVKRVIGLPNDIIQIKEGRIIANGITLTEADGIPPITYTSPLSSKTSYTVGPNEYFVLGDNSARSSDSRYWGCVPEKAIDGKCTKIYYPVWRWGNPAHERKSLEDSK